MDRGPPVLYVLRVSPEDAGYLQSTKHRNSNSFNLEYSLFEHRPTDFCTSLFHKAHLLIITDKFTYITDGSQGRIGMLHRVEVSTTQGSSI